MELENLQDIIIIKLKLLIKTKYKNQLDFCEKFGMQQAQLSLYFNKKRVTPLEFLNKVSNFFNIDISYFFNEESNTDSISINYELFDEIAELTTQYAKQNNIIISPKKYLILYETISNLKTTNPKTSTKELFDILKLTLITN